MIFVIPALTSAKVREIMNELDCCDPLHHLESKLIFTAEPQWCAVQNAERCSVHFVSKDGQFMAHVGYLVHVIVTPDRQSDVVSG